MAFYYDLTGLTFGRWTVTAKSERQTKDGKQQPFWWCECQCEARTCREVFGPDLKRGGSLSCGCLMRENAKRRRTKHGMCDHPAYNSWKMAKSRCNNPNDDNYHSYGKRGIRMCERWSNDFAAFWQDMGATWTEGLSIERVDVNGDYEPDNCTWATPKKQANNRRNNITISTPDGPMTLKQAAEQYAIPYDTMQSRIRYGWDESDLLLPVRPQRMPANP